MDINGNTIWGKSTIGCAAPKAIALDKAGGIYISGGVNDSSFVVFDNDTLYGGPTLCGSEIGRAHV